MTAPMTHEELRLSLGAHALGILDDAEQAEVEAHLAGCPECRAELERLEAAGGVLGLLSLQEVTAGAPSADRAVAALVTHRRGGRVRRGMTALGGVAAAAALVTGVGLSLSAQTVERTVEAGDSVTDVWAQVRMTDDPGGTELALRLNGVPPHLVCALVAIGKDGRRQTAATWIANYEGEAEVRGQVGLVAADMVRLEVVTDDEAKPLLTLNI